LALLASLSSVPSNPPSPPALSALSLHDALPISLARRATGPASREPPGRAPPSYQALRSRQILRPHPAMHSRPRYPSGGMGRVGRVLDRHGLLGPLPRPALLGVGQQHVGALVQRIAHLDAERKSVV